MTGLALLVLLGAIVGCSGDIGQSPEEAKVDLERTVEESIVVLAQSPEEANIDLERTVEETITLLEQPAGETSVDLGQPAGETDGFTITGWVTVDAYHYDEETGTYVHFYHDESSNVITTIGIDFIARQLGGAVATDPAKWISLSNDGSSAATWTKLPTELDNTNGMGRKVGIYAHTDGTNTYTIAETFTATGGGATVQTTGLQWVVTLQSDGNLMAANDFTSVILAADDSLTITWTLTLGP